MPYRRLTIIARDIRKPDVDRRYSAPAGEAVAFIDSTSALHAALCAGTEFGLDMRRVIVDRAGTPDELLELGRLQEGDARSRGRRRNRLAGWWPVARDSTAFSRFPPTAAATSLTPGYHRRSGT